MTEEWRPVVGWEGLYEVSNIGRVRSLDRHVSRRDGTSQCFTGRLLTPQIGATGYVLVRLRDESMGRSWMPKVHQLVAAAFIGPCPDDKSEVNHIDGDKRNPAATNLEWVTSRENRKHAWDTGLRTRAHLPIKRGETNGAAKLTAAIVVEARRRKTAGETTRALAREYGVDAATMRVALRGETWTEIPAPPPDTQETKK